MCEVSQNHLNLQLKDSLAKTKSADGLLGQVPTRNVSLYTSEAQRSCSLK